jgi:O-antigen/teichoic acid export membrane protein
MKLTSLQKFNLFGMNSIINSFWYATKVWLTSILLTPLCFTILGISAQIVDSQSKFDWWEILFNFGFLLAIGAVSSCIVWVLFVVVVWRINKLPKNIREKKIWIAVAATLLSSILIYMIPLAAIWWVLIIIGVIFHKLEKDYKQ